MKIVISPAKTLDYQTPVPISEYSFPFFLDKSQELVQQLQQLSPDDIANLMAVSPSLAELNFLRFQQWCLPFNLENARQSLFAFNGDVYEGIAAHNLNHSQLQLLNARLRILSGLYGILKPFDLIQPYRLEMGTKLHLNEFSNLYQFWGSAITDALNEEFADERSPILVNLASEEYFKSIKTEHLNARIVTPVFLEATGDKPKVVSFKAKKARGMMVRFIAEQEISVVEDLKSFDYGGYAFSEAQSSENKWIFIR